ncbi:hypothetical protein QQF64_034250 [Cirrhinus molitorella]|uniref:Uncharacterized protein n=1 Tax=Cirrhinus molitorella TaxID=172907 RepID=A0ABR3MW88_9TELE
MWIYESEHPRLQYWPAYLTHPHFRAHLRGESRSLRSLLWTRLHQRSPSQRLSPTQTERRLTAQPPQACQN